MPSTRAGAGFAHVQTKPPLLYYPPSTQEVYEAMQARNLGDYDPSFVADIANVAAGGTVLPQTQWENHYRNLAHLRTAEAVKGETPDMQAARRASVEKLLLEDADRTARFLAETDLSRSPGVSPLTKALLVCHMLKNMRRNETSTEQLLRAQSSNNKTGPESGNVPISGTGKGPQNRYIKEVSEALEHLEQLPEEFLETFGEQEDRDSQVEDLMENSCLLTTTKQRTKQSTPEGSHEERKALRDFRHLSKMTRRSRAQLALGVVGRAHLATGGLFYKNVFAWKEQKTLLYVLVDVSGSMNSPWRIGAALGSVQALATAVKAGAAELYLRFFDGTVGDLHHVKSPLEVPEWVANIRRRANFRGGSTDIHRAITTALRDIHEWKDAYRPELLVVSDGQDQVSTTLSDLGRVKLHSVQIGEDGCARLAKLVSDSRGLQIQV